jgi:hypothetical protein
VTLGRDTNHAETSQDPVEEPENVGSDAATSGEQVSSVTGQKTLTSRTGSKDDGTTGEGSAVHSAFQGSTGSQRENQGPTESISVSSPSKIDRLRSVLGEFGRDELADVLARAFEGNASKPSEISSSAAQEALEAVQPSSGNDERLLTEPTANDFGLSREVSDDTGRIEGGITLPDEKEVSLKVSSTSPAIVPTLLSGFTRVQLNQFEKIFGFYQSEWKARSQQDLLNKDLVMRAELQQAELNLQQERFAAEQAKLKADLDHQQELAKLEARKESTGELTRSVVLFLVVLAVVLTPLLAMGWLKVPPQSFSQYVAPITGITGTVLGYWFGRQDPKK